MTPIAVYVHIPFCLVKCGYCDFNTYAGLDALKGDYGRALIAEVEAWRDVLEGRPLGSISFGGGTPGEFPATALAAVIGAVRTLTTGGTGAEISLEANPGTTSFDQLLELREAGVNRVSFGAQSFAAAELQFLDRVHSPEATAASVANARRAGIASVGLDLIYGLPGQSPAAWETSLAAALALDPDHLSCYALTVEEGTPLAASVARGDVEPCDDDRVADMYEAAGARLQAAGYSHYELSNWARPGHESRHNLVYWTGGDYLGLGAGAHGYLAGDRYENIAHPRQYNRALLGRYGFAARPAIVSRYRPDETTAMGDWLETSLRLIEGFQPAAFEARFGLTLVVAAGEEILALSGAGVLDDSAGSLRLTPRGRLLHMEVSARLLAALRRSVIAR